jgi:CRISPR/Cas system-associated exonuclease Cas4 (RecB family)
MIPVNKLFNYVTLERVTSENGDRYYVCPEGNHLSSVTTILGATGDKTGLLEWRAWVGDKKADQIRDEACALGTLMHTHLENYIQKIDRPGGSNIVRQMARNMADAIINRGLVNVSEVWAMEEMLYYPGLYAGTADLIGMHKGEPAIMDYKTTNKMKTKDKIGDYSHQLAAYAMAHNELFGTNIQKGVIFMVSRDLQFEEYVFDGEEFNQATREWVDRVDTFLSSK